MDETTDRLTSRLVLLMADRLTLPPDDDRLRQIFNTAAELRRCISRVGEFAEAIVPTEPDRRWWLEVYRAGIKADLDKQPRTPPEGLTADQRDTWLAGYDR